MHKTAQPVFRFEGTITNPQLQYFRKHGIIQFRNFVDRNTAQRFIYETENVQDQLLRYDIKKVNGIPLKFGQDETGAPFIQRIAFASQYSDTLSNFLKDKRLQALTQLLAPYRRTVQYDAGESSQDCGEGIVCGKSGDHSGRLIGFLPEFFPKIFVEKIAAGIYEPAQLSTAIRAIPA